MLGPRFRGFECEGSVLEQGVEKPVGQNAVTY
jgi:hypothetical protein